MDFKKCLLVLCLPIFASCGVSVNKDGQYTIGETLKNVSALTGRDGAPKQKVTIFDKTTHKVRRFDLATMAHEKSFDVPLPDLDHTVLYDEGQGYGIDLTSKNLEVFDDNGQLTHVPLQFEGVPASAAFAPEQGLLVVYDSLKAVEIVHITNQGHSIESWLGGPRLNPAADSTIASGDLNASGQLILGMSDGSIATVDVLASVQQRRWIFTLFATTIPHIQFVAPVRSNPDYVMVVGAGEADLVQLSQQTVLDRFTFDNSQLIKMSRGRDPHFVLRYGDETKLVYLSVPNSKTKLGTAKIQTQTMYAPIRYLTFSTLDLQNDFWSFIDATQTDYYASKDSLERGRILKVFRVSDQLAMKTKNLPDRAQLEPTLSSVFALFPSALGYAVNYNLFNDGQSELRMFNMPDIK
jgi:hypothetical protein